MKKTVYLAIIGVVTAICVIVGLIVHGYDMYSFQRKTIVEENLNVSEENAQNLDSFQRMDVDVKVMDLTIRSGNAYSVSVKSVEKLMPDITVSNGTLAIRQNNVPKSYHKDSRNCKVILTIPSGEVLESAELSNSVGDILWNEISCDTLKGEFNVGDIEIRRAKIPNLDVTVDVGEISIENCELDTAVCESNVGDVDIERCVFNSMEISDNTGDVEVHSSVDLSGYQMELSTNVGEVEVNDRYYKKSYNQNGANGKLTLETNVGDVDVDY